MSFELKLSSIPYASKVAVFQLLILVLYLQINAEMQEDS